MFVANPKKPPQIENILKRNRDKLLVFLQNFHNDKEGMCNVDTIILVALLTIILCTPFGSIDEQFTVRIQSHIELLFL